MNENYKQKFNVGDTIYYYVMYYLDGKEIPYKASIVPLKLGGVFLHCGKFRYFGESGHTDITDMIENGFKTEKEAELAAQAEFKRVITELSKKIESVEKNFKVLPLKRG